MKARRKEGTKGGREEGTKARRDEGTEGRSLHSVPPFLRLGVLLSGGGRTLLNIHEHIREGKLRAKVVCVVSSRADAYGVKRARDTGFPVHVVSRKQVPDPDFHERIRRHLAGADVELVCMAGFCCMWHIPPEFAGRVMNIHPALLPDFGGKGFYGNKVHEAVIASGRRTSGCTVHFCDNEYDHGPIILQRQVPVLKDDTPESLAARVFEQECIAYPRAIARFAEGRLRIVDGKVKTIRR